MPERRTKKAKRGGVKGLTMAALAATASAARPEAQTHMVGPAYAQSIPPPSRQGRLNVYPTPTPSPGPASINRWTSQTTGNTYEWVNKYRHAYEPVWPKANPGRVKGMFEGAFDPKEGTRWVAPPEVQTWNPYLRGDSKEIVDYYEGYSEADKAKFIAKDEKAGLIREKVPRQNTPMWRAAESWSVHLPEVSEKGPNLEWESFANQGRKLGMNVPLKDPRIYKKGVDPKWLNVPERIDNEILRTQLYHNVKKPFIPINKGPLQGMINDGPSYMKGSMEKPYHWQESSLANGGLNWKELGPMTRQNINNKYKYEQNQVNKRTTRKKNYPKL